MHLKDFVESTLSFGFSIMDETYGFNQAKYNGYLLENHRHCECMVEIVYQTPEPRILPSSVGGEMNW